MCRVPLSCTFIRVRRRLNHHCRLTTSFPIIRRTMNILIASYILFHTSFAPLFFIFVYSVYSHHRFSRFSIFLSTQSPHDRNISESCYLLLYSFIYRVFSSIPRRGFSPRSARSLREILLFDSRMILVLDSCESYRSKNDKNAGDAAKVQRVTSTNVSRFLDIWCYSKKQHGFLLFTETRHYWHFNEIITFVIKRPSAWPCVSAFH